MKKNKSFRFQLTFSTSLIFMSFIGIFSLILLVYMTYYLLIPFTSSTIGTARKMARRSTRRSLRRAAAGRAGSRGRRCMQLSRTCILRAGRSWRSGLCVRPPPFKAAGEGPFAFERPRDRGGAVRLGKRPGH